jgi:hypothetical protein
MGLALILLASAAICTAIVVTICRACEVKRGRAALLVGLALFAVPAIYLTAMAFFDYLLPFIIRF